MLAHRSRTAITAARLPGAGHLLLVGAAGTGKSALALRLSTLVRHPPLPLLSPTIDLATFDTYFSAVGHVSTYSFAVACISQLPA